MILSFSGGEVWMISGPFGTWNGLKETSRRFQAVLDIFWALDLPSLTIVGWENRHQEARLATTAEKETLILKISA
jgi:hypothetical protein